MTVNALIIEYGNAITERLNTIIEQQADIIALLKRLQPEQKLPKAAGPYLNHSLDAALAAATQEASAKLDALAAEADEKAKRRLEGDGE
jgi:hypothetical protein